MLDAYAAEEPLRTQTTLVLDVCPTNNQCFQSRRELEVLLLEKPRPQAERCRRQFGEGLGQGPCHQAINR